MNERSLLAGWQVEFAPFAVLRSSGVSIELVRRIFPGRLSTALADAVAAEQHLTRLRPHLEELLHRWIGMLDDDKLRHRVLALKRSVHNERHYEHARHVGLLELSTCPEVRSAIDQWLNAARRLEMAQAIIEEDERRLTSDAFMAEMLSLFDHEAFATGLTHSAPSLFRVRDKVANGTLKLGRRSRFVNTVLSYLLRAGTKISPLTTFMQCSLLNYDWSRSETRLDFTAARLDSVSSLDRGAFALLYEAEVERRAANPAGLLFRNPTLSFEGGIFSFAAMYYAPGRGRYWKTEQAAKIRLEPGVADVLRTAEFPITASTFTTKLVEAGLTEERAVPTLRSLLKRRILTLASPPDPLEPSLHRLSRSWLAAIGAPPQDDALATLAAAESLLASFPRADTPARISIVEGVSREIEAYRKAIGMTKAPHPGMPIIENSWWRGGEAVLGKDVIEKVEDAAKAVREMAMVSPLYLWLRARFIERFGSGGVCRDVTSFLSDLAARYGASLAKAAVAPEGPVQDLDLSAIRIPVSFHLQFNASTVTNGDEAGRPITINAVYPRGLWQLSRYTINTADAELNDQVRKWLLACAAPEEPVAVVVGPEATSLQNHGRLTERMVDFSRVSPSPGWLCGDELELVHDPVSGRILCRDLAGYLLRPFYLGGALPAPHFGAAFFLCVLGEPILIQPRVSTPAQISMNQGEVVRHQPRKRLGGCTIMPEMWLLDTGPLRSELAGKPLSAQIVRLARRFAELHLPPEGTAFGLSKNVAKEQSVASERMAKAMWFRLDETWCARRLVDIVEEFDFLVVGETLPEDPDSSITIRGERHLTEFHIEAAFSWPGAASGSEE